jgi:membrane-associated phospholipid phosphatase
MEAAGISSDLRDEFAHSSKDDSPVPALDAERGSFAERIGNRLTGLHPILVFLAGILLCYLVLASITLAVGLIFTDAILPLGSLDEADSRPVEWLADERTATLTDLSFVGSEISGGIVLPILVGLLAIAFAIRRHWLLAAFVIFGVALESATYRTTVQFVDRERPDVPRLEGLPPDHSFPSGHVAASIVVYGGLALLLTSRMSSRRGRIAVWAIAVAIPVVVAAARMYRGMHHPLDMLAGVLVGIAALALVVFVARVTGVVARRRDADAVGAAA